MRPETILAVLAAQRGLAALRSLKEGHRASRAMALRLGSDVRMEPIRDHDPLAGIRTAAIVAGSTKTTKASSAESILRYCLSRRGWLRRWRAGKLTGIQHLNLLRDIRLYGRAWLRHEAQVFFDSHGLPIERGLIASAASALDRWFGRTKQFVRELIFAGVMSAAGTQSLAQEDVEAAERQNRVQQEFLENFRREIITNPPPEIAAPRPAPFPSDVTVIGQPKPMTRNQAIARAETYGNAAWEAGQKQIRRAGRKIPNAKFERRVLGHPKTHHCDDCPPLAALGWQPIGTLPDIGDSECGGMCLCHFEYTDDPGAKAVKIPKQIKIGRPKGVGKPQEAAKRDDLPSPLKKVGDKIVGPWLDENGDPITYEFFGPDQ